MRKKIKNKIIIIDLIGAPGHVNWLKKLLSIIQIRFEIVFISYKSYCRKLEIESCIPLNDKYLNYKNKYKFVINQVIVLKKIKKIINQFEMDIPIFISGFDNISYGISRFRKRKVFLHMHSNTDKSQFSKLFLWLFDKSSVFVFYEKFILDYMKKYNNKAYVLNHTLNFTTKEIKNSFGDYIFIPSKIDDIKQISTLISFAKINNLKIILRSDSIASSDIITSKQFFEDYDEMFRLAKYVGIYAPYNYRISGVFYEAMLFNKLIIEIGYEGVFIREMKKDFPSSFIEINDTEKKWTKKLSLDKKNREYISFINAHCDLTVEQQFYNIIMGSN